MDQNAQLYIERGVGAIKVAWAPATSRSIFPDPGIWRIGPDVPVSTVELLDPQRAEIHAVQTAHVNHIFRRVGSWPVERGDPAVFAEKMPRRERPELISLQILCARH